MQLRSGGIAGRQQLPLPATAAKKISQDPLTVLGTALFFEISGYLPFISLTRLPSVCKAWRDFSIDNEACIWRKASGRFGLQPRKIAELREIERDSHEAGEKEPRVDWRELCKRHLQPGVNWANGSFSASFVKHGRDSLVQTFVVDEEDRTCLMLCQKGGIEVHDIDTSELLFIMPRVRPNGIMMICRGFLVLRRWAEDFCFHVFRTRSAVARSARPWSPESKVISEARGSRLAADPNWRAKSTLKPRLADPTCDNVQRPPETARGCLSYYRNIIMDGENDGCFLGVDHEGTELEPVILAVLLPDKIVLCDLEDPERPQQVLHLPVELTDAKSINFNDDFIFLCGTSQIHIISRSTVVCVLSFPPGFAANRINCEIAISIEHSAETGKQADTSITQRLRVEEHRGWSPKWEAMMSDLDVRLPSERGGLGRSPTTGFLASHPAGADLVCAHRKGYLVVIKNYVETLKISSLCERLRTWEQRTVVIDLATTIKDMSVCGTRVVLRTNWSVTSRASRTIMLDTSSLACPLPPLPSSSVQAPSCDRQSSLKMRLLVSPDSRYGEKIGEPQLYSTAFYSTYLAFGPSGLTSTSLCVRRLYYGPSIEAEGEKSTGNIEWKESPRFMSSAWSSDNED